MLGLVIRVLLCFSEQGFFGRTFEMALRQLFNFLAPVLVLGCLAAGLDLDEGLGGDLVLDDDWPLVLILRKTWAEISVSKTLGWF